MLSWSTASEQANKVGPKGGLLTDIDSSPLSTTYGPRNKPSRAVMATAEPGFRGSTV